jgi:hypothetical protein
MSIQKKLTEALQYTDKTKMFMPPDNGDKCWTVGSENFTREEVAHLLCTQIAMIGNDLRAYSGKDLTKEMCQVIDNLRIPKF